MYPVQRLLGKHVQFCMIEMKVKTVRLEIMHQNWRWQIWKYPVKLNLSELHGKLLRTVLRNAAIFKMFILNGRTQKNSNLDDWTCSLLAIPSKFNLKSHNFSVTQRIVKGPFLFLTTESSLKMMKNVFYFMLKALFVLEIFIFVLTFWSCRKMAWWQGLG